jgi:peptidyl-prolyl cis-trans isomerase SurA
MSVMSKPGIVLLALLASATAPAAELVERIVARVNNNLITQSEYDKRISAAQKGARGASESQQMRLSVLEDMIKEKLLEERAREMAVTATDEEVETAVQRVKAQYQLSTDAEFEAALSQSGMTREDLRRQMRETITLQKVVGRDVTSRMDQSDDALRLEYERQKDKFYAVPEVARVAEILLKFSPSDAEARQQAVAKIDEIRTRIKTGTPFAELAREASEGSARERGGDLGLVSKGELVEALDAGIFTNPPAEYPAPVLMAGSIHLFHVTDRKPAGFRPFAEVKEDVRKRISDDLYEKRFKEYMDRLRRDAYVKIYDSELAKLDEKKAS